MRDGIAKLAALVNGAGRFRRAMAADAAGEAELLEEAPQPLDVFRLVGTDLGIRALEVGVGENGRRPMAGAGDEDHVEIVLFDEAIEVDINKAHAGVGSPVPEQSL